MAALSKDAYFWQWYVPGSPAYQYYEVANSFPGQTAADKQYNYANARNISKWGFENAYQNYLKQYELTEALKIQQEQIKQQVTGVQAKYAVMQQQAREGQAIANAAANSLKILQASPTATAPTAQVTKKKAAGAAKATSATSSLLIGSTGQGAGSGANLAV